MRRYIFFKCEIIQRMHYNCAKDAIIQVKTSYVFKKEIQAYYAFKKTILPKFDFGVFVNTIYINVSISHQSVRSIEFSQVLQYNNLLSKLRPGIFNRKKYHI